MHHTAAPGALMGLVLKFIVSKRGVTLTFKYPWMELDGRSLMSTHNMSESLVVALGRQCYAAPA